ncbi:hypothetical protein A2643_01420 [Candidatus Nomurabacteria bacterium RIFCSPHIGHO2_01_FULL_39_220]|uniref:Cell shape-determining protein MreC n=1 Tax=Candidatus Nomurabacteria bacterium RIFCSPLOWO2_02_FULL_40_67 TaxID=1801787 RepID=A0A1F6Y3U3_9BACT|nr:MAG: hypothetical protein UU01_C0001G0013 [Parcubacteria group bacterium GW2011_GWA2_40_37]KKS12146.1 MAG: hypothetical protein UU66_C0001G0005 [Parcubacteria group bacterium GW2011_GWB1_41_5]KKS72570.1 MAG: hypothetical protein UV43_C0015G0003 [Parcubacteria group bacterium GW2011_GWF2_42_7]OGI61864.1 MAG: hypothetical protein A2W12_00230 [Candidatus Nomurabacteria bacterium RBG_16_40_11]OGI69356.1 MAG: hypothetical protein A2643_01420 [Candidatus Nomurabacteria bacterium RIFCSPHIGHO2_01_FU
MSYLLDKKIQRKKILYAVFSAIILLVLFYFRFGLWNGLAYFSHTVFRPILIFGNNVGGKLNSARSYFASKNSLYLENQNLQSKITENEARMSNYNSLLYENENLKEILDRKDEKTKVVLGSILSKPNQSPYDTLVLDIGADLGIKSGERVLALGNVLIGRIANIYHNSSKVILFSSNGEKTQVVVVEKNLPAGRQGVFLELVGRGGGNFEMIMPRDLKLEKGDQVVLPGIIPYVVGIVETIISDPRDPFVKALLTSPVNIQELKFVEVETQK